MDNKKQLIYSILSLFLLGLIVAGGTFAYYSFTSSNNKNVVFNTSKELQNYIIYNEGESKFSGNFKVSSTYTEGIHSTISLYKTTDASTVTLIASINMDINEIGTNMVNSPALKWVVTSGTSTNVGSVLAQGNFIGVNNNDTITLVPNTEVTTTETFYTIWIWLDENANPSDELTGETLDVNVWTEINQVEAIDDSFEITRINANYQEINATVINNKSKITSYAVTTSNTTPSSWTSISSSEQSNVYNLDYTVSQTGTYYVWFKSNDNKTVSRSVTVSSIDTTGPVCTWGSFNPSSVSNGETSRIELTCIDNESSITSSNLKPSDLILSNNYVLINTIGKTSITNGYKYTITLTGTNINGTTNIKLPANKIKNRMNLNNTEVTSSNITIANYYLITINAGRGVSTLSATDWNNNGTSSITKLILSNSTLDLSTITINYKNGYIGTEYIKTSGAGTISDNTFTSGEGTTVITINATGLETPTCGMTGGGQVIYGNNATINANNTINYDSGVTLYYKYGYSTSSSGALSHYTEETINNSLEIEGTTYFGTRYYGMQVYATDGTFTSSTCTTGTDTTNRAMLQFVNAKITFNPNGGSLIYASYSPRYTRYGYTGNTYMYSSLTGTSTGSSPTASRTGFTFMGWWTAPTGGYQVLTASRAFTGVAVEGYTTTNSWVVLEDKELYAQWKDSAAPTLSFAEDNPTVYEKPKTGRITINDTTGIAAGTYTIKYSTSTSTCSNSSMTPVTITVNEGDTIAYSDEITISSGSKVYLCNVETITDVLGYVKSIPTTGTYVTLHMDTAAPAPSATASNSSTWTTSKDVTITLSDTYSNIVPGTYTIKYALVNSSISCDSMNDSITLTVPENTKSVSQTVTISEGTGQYLYLCNVEEISDIYNNKRSANSISSSIIKIDNSPPTGFISSSYIDNIVTANVIITEDSGMPSTNGYGWAVLDSNICDSSLSFVDSDSSTYSFNISYEDISTKFICIRATDILGNVGYIGSSIKTYLKYLGYDYMDFKESTYKNKIENISFVNYIDTSGSVKSYDLSQVGDNSIIGWLSNSNNSMYNLYIGSYLPIYSQNLSNTFAGMNALTSINFDKFNSTEVTNMAYMFAAAGQNATNLNLNLGNNFNASNVINMYGMFQYTGQNATNLNLDLGNNFNASNVTNMSSMFSGLGQNAININLNLGNNFNPSNVTNMTGMFTYAGRNATQFSLNLGNNFDTSNVIIMDYMFSSLGANATNFSFNLGNNFDTSNVTKMSDMFSQLGANATNFSFNLGNNFDTSNVTSMYGMFSNFGKKATNLDLNLGDKFDTSNVSDMQCMFCYAGANAINFSLNLGDNFNASNVTRMNSMFERAGVSAINFNLKIGNNFNSKNVINMSRMFRYIGYNSNKFSLDLGNNFDTSNVTNMYGMFENMGTYASSFSMNLGNNFDTSKVKDMIYMFYYVGYNASNFDLNLGNKFDTSNVNDMSGMFEYAGRNATNFSLNLGTHFDTSNVTKMYSMFSGAYQNATNFSLNLGDKFNTSNVRDMRNMFSWVGSNVPDFTLNLGNNFDTSNATTMSYMFYQLGANANNFNLNLGNKFDTSNVTDMSLMFSGVGSNVPDFTLNLGNKFDTSNVTSMYAMFSQTGFNTINFNLNLGNNFDTSKVTNMDSMFMNASSNATNFTLNLGNKFDTSNVTSMFRMFSAVGSNATKFELNLGNKFNTSKVKSMSNMFMNVGQTATNFSLNLGDYFNTSNVTGMIYMFFGVGQNASNFSLNLGNNFDTSNVTNTRSMFVNVGNKSLSNFNLDLSAGDFNKVSNYSGMFNNISKNATILVKDSNAQNWIISKKSEWGTNFSTTNVLIK